MTTKVVRLSSKIYEILRRRAQERDCSPDELAEELLTQELLPDHPYIQVYLSRSGPRPVLKGTHTPVSIIVGYIRLGHEPERIAQDILPHLTLAQIHDALSYYYDHQQEIDRELAEDSEASWKERLRDLMHSEEDFARITGHAN